MGLFNFIIFISFWCLSAITLKCKANDILGCGGFVKSHANIDFSKIEIGLYTKQGSLKEKTECAPTNGYYFLPLYEKGEYILKLNPPPGWSFEPSEVSLNIDGSTDPCSTGQDINFAFNGFGITGKVITYGQNKGPAGISVKLVDEKGETRDTKTTDGGHFHFTPVIPGKYTVKASHPRWKLEPAVTSVRVTEGNTALPVGALAVSGYDVTGTVLSRNKPIPGVHVLLYSVHEKPTLRVEGCKTALLQGVPDSPICYSVTDSNGLFTFGLVPAGEYYILPLAKNPGQNKLTYNIKPDRVNINVQHDSLYIKSAFEINGYTVLGNVVTQPDGKGMEGVRVSLDGEPVGVTDAAGKYTLVNLQAGKYKLEYSADNCEFAENEITITPEGTVLLIDTFPVKWRVCGTVTVSGSATKDKPRTVTIRHDSDRYPAVNVNTEPGKGGSWCTYLQPGVYIASVSVSDQERRDGLQFFPLSQKVTVGRAPSDGISFSQLKAKLKGVIKCKEDGKKLCSDLKVTIRHLLPDGSHTGQPTVVRSQGGVYELSEVLPGSLEVSVGGDRLCWVSRTHNVAVSGAEADVPPFVQTGYAVTFSSSHPTEVEYEGKKEKGVLRVSAGVSQHCVGNAERYTFRVVGCRKYTPDVVEYDVAKEDEPIMLTAISAEAGIHIVSTEKVDDLMLHIDSMGEKVYGPLVPKETNGNYLYEHTLQLGIGEFVVVSAHSSSLLIKPASPQQIVGSDECRQPALVLQATKGLTLTGTLKPPVSQVTISLLSGGEEIDQLVTKEDGAWRFGPLDATQKYEVRAEKESYIFTAPDAEGVIKAHKLAEINIVLVDDADGKPLQGGLVSVSGGDYRRNQASGADGVLVFASLAPADYFVKPFMKEYKFTPAHKIVHVAEGNTYKVTLRGVRVAWSGSGRLVSLGGVGVSGATITASPASGACAAEEATTEQHTGAFRLRGLLPGCRYTLALSMPNSGLKLAGRTVSIELSSPPTDIEDIRLLAVQPSRLTDATVLVVTPNVEHYKTLTLKLWPEDTPDKPGYSTKLDAAGYTKSINPGLMYVLPRLPADGKSYQLQLESSLSQATHAYTIRPHHFTSDGEFKHFTIEFTPKLRSTEQELSQTSLLVLPLLGLLGLALLYRERVLATLTVAGERLSDCILHAASTKPAAPQTLHNLLDESQINQIVQNVNAVNRRKTRKV